MSYSKLIHEYLDTGLPPAEEDALFQQLANNSELRADFEKQVKINKIASNDMNSISPPIETTNAVFSGLGFSIPSDGSNAIPDRTRKPGAAVLATTSTSAGILGSLRENVSTIFSIGIAAIISTLLFMLFDEEGNQTRFANNSGINSELTTNIPVTTSMEVPKEDLAEASINSNNITPLSKDDLNSILSSIIFPIVDAKPAEENLAENTYKSTITENTNSVKNNVNDFRNFYSVTNSSRIRNSSERIGLQRDSYSGYNQFSQLELTTEELNMVEVELRGYNSSAENLSNKVSDNISVGLKLNFTENHSIVGYIGNDEYFVRTKNPILPTENAQFDNRNMVSYMIGYRYTQNGIVPGDFIAPYGQVLVGGLSNGFGTRGEVGIVLKPEDRISFIIGYGTNHIQYMMEGDWYETNRNGINFGVSYGM